MNRRPVWLALALVLTAVPAAEAARAKPKPPPPICNLLVDPPNDAVGPFGQKADAFNNGNFDIVGAEMGSNGRVLTLVLKLRDIAQPDDNAPWGQRWTIGFNIGNERFDFLTGTSRLATNMPDNTTGTIDAVKNEIRVHVPFSELTRRNVPTKAGTVVKGISASSGHFVALPRELGRGSGSTVGLGGDTAETTRTYPLNAASCVAVGK